MESWFAIGLVVFLGGGHVAGFGSQPNFNRHLLAPYCNGQYQG
jgi:hypothetical protein